MSSAAARATFLGLFGISVTKADPDDLVPHESRNPRGLGNLLALGLIIVGAFALAIATFLPLNQPPDAFTTVVDNTLIEHGGWTYIVFAVFIALGGIQAYRRVEKAWQFTVGLCVVVAIKLIWAAGNNTLYPAGTPTPVDPTQPGVVAPLGIAIYVAGMGLALAVVGSVMLRLKKQNPAPQAVAPAVVQTPTKKCPVCAESILADAKVCKHSGHRFPVTKVKCHRCQHVQAVPQSESTSVCEQCGVDQHGRVLVPLTELDFDFDPQAPKGGPDNQEESK
jgi:hypothetical protein